jgi:cysteine-rich repeat protein
MLYPAPRSLGRLVLLGFATCLLLPGTIPAADHPVEGRLLRLRDGGVENKRLGRFVAARQPAVDLAEIPDPRTVPSSVQIRGVDPGDGSSGVIDLAPERWQPLGTPPGSKGWKYFHRERGVGATRVVIRGGAAGARILFVARRAHWPYEVTQPQGPVLVHLQLGDELYCAAFQQFARNEVRPNGVGIAVARNSPPPVSCTCGNTEVEPPEECDDGNLVDGDGCDSNCTVTGCGNGIVTAGEECDDGNDNNDDACTNACTLNVCGDGHLHTGVEECDDGNLTDGDGCDSNCTATGCGNGIATAGEECDDGGFSATCDDDCTFTDCGDGTLNQAADEQCDDGNTEDGDGCDSSCQFEGGGDLCAGVPQSSGTAIRSEVVASGLSGPVQVIAPPGDVDRIFIVEKAGRIRILRDGALLPTPFLNVTSKVSGGFEQGLLSMAFHPSYAGNGRFFVNYTNTSGNTVIARYVVSGDPDIADAASETILLTVAQPFANHNGGQLAFAPDGTLYAGMGDGGSGGDPLENGQSDTTVHGKMLRMNVDVETPPYYAVPPTNPNPGAGAPLGLIWAKGLRNPWRFSFDRLNGDLVIADVGQNAREEINLQRASSAGGENYGWDIFEGTLCFDPEPHDPACPSPPTGFTMPIHEYSHSGGACSITGGFVYRGCAMPDLHGTYFYADWCAGFIRTFTISAGGAAQNHADRTIDLGPGGGLSINNPTAFGEDARGEIYVCDQGGGEVFKIVPP